MNLSPGWIPFLGNHQIAATHWSEVGAVNASDAVLLEWARANGHIVLTHDLDFAALIAAAGTAGPSVVQVRAQDVLPEAIGPDVVRVLTDLSAELERGAIVSLDEAAARVRILPIGPGHRS